MRTGVVAATVLMAALFPETGNAQVYTFETPAPTVTAANEVWQLQGEPIFYAGSYYYPAGPTVYFDGNVMKRTGTWYGVPLYSDATLEPYSVVYVPIGGNIMRPYERLREGELAGTVGSRTPSFPIQRDVEVSSAAGYTGLQYPPLPAVAPQAYPESVPPPSNYSIPRAMAPAPPSFTPPLPEHMESVLVPEDNLGIWVEYDNVKWIGSRAVPFAPDQFIKVGEYHEFPVYRQRNGSADEIYIPAVKGGMVTRYEKRR